MGSISGVLRGIHARLIFSVGVALCVASAIAQPARFNYQAKLTDSNGVPLQGAHTM